MTGVPCYFVRMSGCNMWDGRLETRSKSECPFCDTDFYKGEKMTAPEIVAQIKNKSGKAKWVTISGGEPALQLAKDPSLIKVLQDAGYLVAVETNGTIELPEGIDHVTLSPKQPPSATVIKKCDTLKVLYPHPNHLINPLAYSDILAFERYVQPIEPPMFAGQALHDQQWKRNTEKTLEWLYEHPDWKLSAQVHKFLEVE